MKLGRFLRKFTKRFFVVLNVAIAILFLIACFVPYLNPAKWWWIGFTSLTTPYLAIILFLFIIFWLLMKPRLAVISIIVLPMGWIQLRNIFAVNFNTTFNEKKDSLNIRLVDWNVAGMSGLGKVREKRTHSRQDIADAVLKLNPDIICLQEFNHSTDTSQANNIGMFIKDYPYYYFPPDVVAGNYLSGNIIFSKYKIVNSGKVIFFSEANEELQEGVVYADILKGNDTIRIFTVHLQSFKFTREDYNNIDNIKKEKDNASWNTSKSTMRKMKYAFTRRGKQADIVRAVLDTCRYPSFICGDFNDVPNSYTYLHIRKNRQDAFLRKDYGVGCSFIAIAPTLRIDYILPDNNFKIHQFAIVDEGLSDHLMLVTDMSFKK